MVSSQIMPYDEDQVRKERPFLLDFRCLFTKRLTRGAQAGTPFYERTGIGTTLRGRALARHLASRLMKVLLFEQRPQCICLLLPLFSLPPALFFFLPLLFSTSPSLSLSLSLLLFLSLHFVRVPLISDFYLSFCFVPSRFCQVPEAKFSYDLSPMSVYIKQRRRKWYDFLTSVLAIVGGTFTVVGVLDNILFRVVKQKKI